MPPGRRRSRGRRSVVSAAAVTVLVLAGCTSGPAPSGGTRRAVSPGAPARSSAGAGAASSRPSTADPLPPGSGDARHPGAAVLAGDVPEPGPAPVIPPLAGAAHDTPASVTQGCQVSQSASRERFCSFGDTTRPRLTIALVGDSVAGQWLPPLQRIAAARHWKIVTDLRSRCPFTATMTVNIGETAPYTRCHDWGVSVLRTLLTRLRPDVVITSDRPVLGVPGHPRPDSATRAAIGHGMATYWRALIAHHIPAVAIRESAELGIDEPSCLRSAGHAAASCTVAAADAIIPDPPTVVAAAEVPAAHLIDMNRYVCAARCRPIVGNVLVFRDAHHLTATYAATTAPYLERALRSVPVLRR
jgi:SGNH domain (fused to AT3 domains)